MRFHTSSLAFSILAVMATNTFAQSEQQEDTSSSALVLPKIKIQAEKQEKNSYAAKTAATVLRSNAPLFETAQSISVVTNQQIEQKQAKTISEALEGVAGVSSGQYGRRGWDDFIIRGQISSSQTYIDGLRVQTSDNVLRAEDISGLESIEVVKGPTSVGFGFALPGGLVNLTTKRPQAETSYRGTLSYGSYNLREGTFDINYAPNSTEKGAFRLVGRVSDQDDPTDYVYFKNYYIAPSYNFDLGEKDDLSVIASYQHREYVRQQGIPHGNSSTYKSYSHNLFFGEPDHGYNVNVYRAGANYAHYFDNWTYKQNFAVTKTDTQGDAVLAVSNTTLPTIKRAVNNQDKQDINYTLDSNLQRNFNFGGVNYNVMVGLDMMKERSDYYRRTDTINSFNADHPNYSIQTGEQKTKGFEAEMAASLTDQWNAFATYSYIPTAKVTESVTASEIGKRANHVPKNAGTLSTQYYFSPDKLGWNMGVGIRYQGLRTAQRGTAFIELPSYTVFDVNAGYEAKNWGAGLAIKNLFDREYLAGTTPNAQLVNWGDPRMIRLNVKFKY